MISVIIPTLNEEARLPALLADLRRERTAHEIIVADGGSTDRTATTAKNAGARVVHAAAGRGHQLAAGATVATGDCLLFLHADARFPSGGLAAIARHLDAAPRPGGGAFAVTFDGTDGFSRWVSATYAWWRRHGGSFYGDAGIFVRADVYRALGGFRPMALMEDYDFVRRLRHHGRVCTIDAPPLIASSRRFMGRSPLAIVGGLIAIHLLYFAGVSPDRLACLYYSRRQRAGITATASRPH